MKMNRVAYSALRQWCLAKAMPLEPAGGGSYTVTTENRRGWLYLTVYNNLTRRVEGTWRADLRKVKEEE